MKPYPWQLDLWKAFEQRIASGKMPHAMLFSGPQGTGKLNFTKAFIYRLFCHDVQQGLACGECDACHLLNVNNHPDLYRVAKLEDKKEISIDQIRELVAYVNLKPHSAPKKIAIIEQAELMNVNAANSLLKTLEEPPESCLLVLLTHRPDKLIATIRSRCQSHFFAVPDQKQALFWLQTKVESTEQAEKLLALANGAPLQAKIYAENNMLEQRDDIFIAFQDVFRGKQNPLNVANLWLKLDLGMTLYCMTSWLTDMIRLSASSQPPVLANPDKKSELLSFSQQSALPQMLEFYDFMINLPGWKRSNINTQLILEEMLVQWSRLNSNKP